MIPIRTGGGDISEEQLASARARHAEDMDKLRVLFRRF